MSDFQQGRVALGARLRELRAELTGRDLAERLGWPQSKVSKLETGRQTASGADLAAWATTTGHPEAAEELETRRRALESRSRSWRRQLAAGHRPVQDALTVEQQRTTVFRCWQPAMVVGILQTPDYARHVFSAFADLHRSPRDLDAAVRSRIERQQVLYQGRKRFRVLLWEAALHATICPPPVLAAQLDRLAGVLGMDTVELGVVPLGAPMRLPPANGFWLYDNRLVVAEDWHAELWLDDTESVQLYGRVWETLAEAAVYGPAAHRLIARARAQIALA